MAKKTYKCLVVSVTYEKGCYRHIRINTQETLYDLADAILYAFDFCNDHAHAFFMNNKIWDNSDAYYLAGFNEDDSRNTDVKLSKLNLEKDDKFKFLFDFGDEWVFQCKVLRNEECEDKDTCILRAVGDPPEQYPDYNDEEYDDSEE